MVASSVPWSHLGCCGCSNGLGCKHPWSRQLGSQIRIDLGEASFLSSWPVKIWSNELAGFQHVPLGFFLGILCPCLFASLLLCLFASLLVCFSKVSAFLFPCCFAFLLFPASLLLCFSSLLVCFSKISAFLLFPASLLLCVSSLLVCFSKISVFLLFAFLFFPASLRLCFFSVLLFCFPWFFCLSSLNNP